MRKILQTPHTFQRGITREISLHYKSLLCPPDLDQAFDIPQFKIIDNALTDFKRKFMAIANFLVNNKADINTEWFTGVRQGSLSSGVQELASKISSAS